jgi:hypothetical protein
MSNTIIAPSSAARNSTDVPSPPSSRRRTTAPHPRKPARASSTPKTVVVPLRNHERAVARAQSTPPFPPTQHVGEVLAELYAWAERARAALNATACSYSELGGGSVLADEFGLLTIAEAAVDTALAAIEIGRTTQHTTAQFQLRNRRVSCGTVHPAEVTIAFGKSYEEPHALASIGTGRRRWVALAKQLVDFDGYARSFVRGGPNFTDEDLDLMADRIVALGTWPKHSDIGDIFAEHANAKAKAKAVPS